MLVTIVIFLVILGVLIFVHEMGHFLTARRNGVVAHEFGFGFPPRAIGIVKNKEGKWKIVYGNREYYGKNTLYSLNIIPLGGFVRIKGENPIHEEDVKDFDKLSEADKEYVKMSEDPDSFATQSGWVRFKILVAGVVMNFVLAWVLMAVVLMMGTPEPLKDASGVFAIKPFGVNIFERHNFEKYDVSGISTGYAIKEYGGKSVLFGKVVFDTRTKTKKVHVLSEPSVMIETVKEGAPADVSGVKMGDVVNAVCVDGVCVDIENEQDLQNVISANAEKEVMLKNTRGDTAVEIMVTPENVDNHGLMGVTMRSVAIVTYPWYEALWEGMMRVISVTWMILVAFGTLIHSLITGAGVSADVAGPVGIAMMAGQMKELGLVYLLQFAAILSVNLGIINILPIPALDGGRILFLIIEKIKGTPVNHKIEGMMHTIFFVALIGFMLIVTMRDVAKLF